RAGQESKPTVKITDLGLARLERRDGDDGQTTGTSLTASGAVMGTPDFMAPEQTRDTHAADCRSDLYSLGCTLYYLLAGEVPFPGGDLIGKLVRHQTDEPRPIEDFRPDLPPGLPALVRKLMAKSPRDRCQTAGELVAILAEGLRTGTW